MNLLQNICPRAAATVLACAAAVLLSSCVHEWPEMRPTVGVRLTIHHEQDWTEYDYSIGRASRAATPAHRARYIIYAYRAGDTGAPALTFPFYSDDNTLADFTTTLSLPPGRWDLHAWQDHEPAGGPAYYDATDLSAIVYTDPYRADIDERQAFEGSVTVDVPESYDAESAVEGRIDMARPMGRYVFIATDFDKFYNETLSRFPTRSGAAGAPSDLKAEALREFSTVARYPFYMPSKYNFFEQRVTDSASGMSYTASIVPLSATEARIASDHVFMNHHDSGVQVQLILRAPDGSAQRLTDVITVPMKRGQITYVRGKFLTAGVGGGLDIDFEFSGDINIEIK